MREERYSLYVEHQRIASGSYESMRKGIDKLSPADRRRGWTIAPISDPAILSYRKATRAIWRITGTTLMICFLTILIMIVKGC